jgi:hypothetical protein
MATVISNINQFLTTVLSSPDFHIPVEANFVVGIDRLTNVVDKLKNSKLVPDNVITKDKWGVLGSDDIFFANGVTIPGESVNASKAGFSSGGDGLYGGLLSGPILTGRANLTNLEITFLETNQSFADQVIRPWIINASHYGLFARDNIDSPQNFKTNITVQLLDKRSSTSNDPEKIRKNILFKNAVPISVEPAALSYGGSKVGSRNVKTIWTYSQYEIS